MPYLDIGPLQSGSGLDIGPLQSSGVPSGLYGESDGQGAAQCSLDIAFFAGEADGQGNASCMLLQPVHLVGEADGQGNAQAWLIVGASLLGEADGVGNAQCYLGGGLVSITCITTGTVSGSPPSPQSTLLYDAPSSW
jgi:hypothetical protein